MRSQGEHSALFASVLIVSEKLVSDGLKPLVAWGAAFAKLLASAPDSVGRRCLT